LKVLEREKNNNSIFEMKIIPNKLITILLSIIVLLLSVAILNSCASTKGYYGRAEMTVAVVSSQKHKVTVGKKNSWEIAYLCKVDDRVVGNNFKGFPSKCKVLPGRRTIEVEHHQQWKDNSSGLVVAGAMFGAIGGAIAGAAAAANSLSLHYAITFDVEQGRSYIINVETSSESSEPTFSVIDSVSGEVVPVVAVAPLVK
jgi:hypothetical protein